MKPFLKKAPAEAPETLTAPLPPYIKDADTTATVMLDVIIALIPAAVWGVIVFGPRALCILLISLFSSVMFEFLFGLLLRRSCTVGDMSAAVTGLLLGLTLPAGVSYWVPVLGSFVAIVIIKQLFGGIGRNYLNPALAGRAVLSLFGSEMSAYPEPFKWADRRAFSLGSTSGAAAAATPLEILEAGEIPETSSLDLIIGRCSGSIGEISAILLFLGGLYLIYRKVIVWNIPASYIITVAALGALFPAAIDRVESAMCEVFCGSLMLCAFFMATDYTTSPVTDSGKTLFGIGCGVLTLLLRRMGGGTDGAVFAVLIMNMPVRFIDMLTRPRAFGAVKKAKAK